MKTIYFKTQAAIDKAAKEMDDLAKPTTVRCAGGESYGYYLDDVKLVLCEGCYNDHELIERGE